MSQEGTFSLELERVQDFEFKASFDWTHLPPLTLDEPEPLGKRKGPNAARLLGAAVGNCLSASLLFCLQKARLEVKGLKTLVTGFLGRNEQGRWRVVRLDVKIILDMPKEELPRISRCLEIFEDYCVVTASVRKGIEVNVLVLDPEGNALLRQGVSQ
ncbi:MAG: OsmC family protein [Anaerolineae bacterium]|nr:OsmC family protein [Anaerolineae bacterium]MDW8100270.1 OsmC family protein [Anaerolineae bacterium]